MSSQIMLGDVAVDVVLKDIKNVHLSVHPPTGRVTISAPLRMKPETIRVFAISKLAWIRQQQNKLRQQERETPREYLDRESHYVWGKRYLLAVRESEQTPSVDLEHSRMVLRVRPGADAKKRQLVVERWYRAELRKALPVLVEKWEMLLGLKVDRFFVQKMKTKWGGCSPSTRTIRLNTELAKKPRECLEYILVHEMAHLLEPTHNSGFVAIMDRFLPKWRFQRKVLNRLPVRHEDWMY